MGARPTRVALLQAKRKIRQGAQHVRGPQLLPPSLYPLLFHLDVAPATNV